MTTRQGLVQGKCFLVTGVLTDQSIAFHIARLIQEEGGEVVLSSFGRAMSITQRIAGRLPRTAPVIELDVTNKAHLDGLKEAISQHHQKLDGVVHSIGFAPESALGGNWDISDPVPAAKGAVALLSDWFPKTTGEIIHVDGGVHAVGA
jgi:enoyl ACP reductase